MSAAMNRLTVGLVLIVMLCVMGAVALAIAGKPCPEIVGQVGRAALCVLSPSPVRHGGANGGWGLYESRIGID